MDELIASLMAWLAAHQILIGMALALAASAAVRSLKAPDEKSSEFYCWFYRWTHFLLQNWELARQAKR